MGQFEKLPNYEEVNQKCIFFSNEIISLDIRIKSCIVENLDEESSKYYVKIWFAYKMNNEKLQLYGSKEFMTETKEKIILEIQDFIKSDKIDWSIL